MFNKRTRSKVESAACIFVHAGAGYHSMQNESTHLQACNDAAKSAMAVLRAGGSAVDAVEIAIRVLEDREITNAGYGSNLAMDGIVECDAVIVDHNGRSGGAGAVAQLKNPISLARLLLDHSATQLTLRRVPPNFLVGQGATDFAWEHGIPVVPHDLLISPSARERWKRWKTDLRAADHKERLAEAARYGISPPPSETDSDLSQQQAEQEHARQTHTKAMQEGLFNEAQPISPPPCDARGTHGASPRHTHQTSMFPPASRHSKSISDSDEEYTDPFEPPDFLHVPTASTFANSTHNVAEDSLLSYGQGIRVTDGSLTDALQAELEVRLHDSDQACRPEVPRGSRWSETSSGSEITIKTPSATRADKLPSGAILEETFTVRTRPNDTESRADRSDVTSADDLSSDNITDTVGAIAIDLMGNIACGASSGGIGMKHRGRVGPAALVGIGAGVIPADTADASSTVVATVTSGTGEHMATTQAASTCSSRIFHSQRRTASNSIEEVTEDEAIQSFVERDFMAHPSVKGSTSTGAIGVLSVKKTKEGAWIYYAHNTDSFALASMSSHDDRPLCTMSRSKGNGAIAQGGRGIRFRVGKGR